MNYSYNFQGILVENTDSFVNLHIDSSEDSVIGHHAQISGSLEVNGVLYENIHGDMLFNLNDISQEVPSDELIFFLYDSEGNNVFNFLSTQDFFMELDKNEPNFQIIIDAVSNGELDH